MELDGRPLPPWNTFCCGGITVHGTSTCGMVETSYVCNCLEKNKDKFNYTLHYDLLANVYQHKMHIVEYLHPRQKMERWEDFVGMLQKSNTIWATYKHQRGSKYEEKLSNAIKLVSKRHGIGSFANGFETHPEMTPFDKLVIQIIKEIEIEKMKKDMEVLHAIIFPN